MNQASSWKWLLDDVVIVAFAATCLAIAYSLGTAKQLYPPTFISIFLGIAVAAITYRYLGGTDNSQLSIAFLKLGGSAALLLGVTIYVGSAVTKERNLIYTANEFNPQIDQLKTTVKNLTGRIGTLTTENEKFKSDREVSDQEFIQRVALLDPDDSLVVDLRNALGDPAGLGREVVRSKKVSIINNGAVRGTKKYWICANTYKAFYPVPTPKGRLRITGASASNGPVDVSFGGIIDNDDCNSTDRKFDMQISCDASALLFPDLITACDGSSPRYTDEKMSNIRLTSVGALVKELHQE